MGKVIGGIVLTIVLAAILFWGGIKSGLFSFSLGSGNGDGDRFGTAPSASEGVPSQPESTDSNKNDTVSKIQIIRNDIFFDDELCENIDSLKQKIIEIGTNREYIFIYDEALKSAYDEVNAVLAELKEALGIIVNEQ